MIKKDVMGNNYLEPELSDVLSATNLGKDHTVEDWPWGRKQRCSMHFSVESHPKRGERFVKQSTMNGRTYRPKKATYATAVIIVGIDGRIGHITYHKMYNHVGINVEDRKYLLKTFFDDEATRVVNHFNL